MGKPTPCNACGMTLLGPCNHPRCWKRGRVSGEVARLRAENERLRAKNDQLREELAASQRALAEQLEARKRDADK